MGRAFVSPLLPPLRLLAARRPPLLAPWLAWGGPTDEASRTPPALRGEQVCVGDMVQEDADLVRVET